LRQVRIVAHSHIPAVASCSIAVATADTQANVEFLRGLVAELDSEDWMFDEEYN